MLLCSCLLLSTLPSLCSGGYGSCPLRDPLLSFVGVLVGRQGKGAHIAGTGKRELASKTHMEESERGGTGPPSSKAGLIPEEGTDAGQAPVTGVPCRESLWPHALL